ncbi:MAG: NTP transferase domain-containing protein [Thermodesulfobacteriota bacterium]
MHAESVVAIVLAGGKGKRMESDLPKVLHPLCGKPMVFWLLDQLIPLFQNRIVVVVGYQKERVQREIEKITPVCFAWQQEQLGTAHAVQCALPVLFERFPSTEHVLILCGDIPLLKGETIQKMLRNHARRQADISLLVTELANPYGYGRVLLDADGHVDRIVEEADCSNEERNVRRINTGIYVVRTKHLKQMLLGIRADNAQREYYLTDIIKIGKAMGLSIQMDECQNPQEIQGINSRSELMRLEAELKGYCHKSLDMVY